MVEQIKKIVVEDEMKKAYLDYSMSVIVSRALPDVRDGLKPVHRRILFAMNNMNLQHNKPFVKSARIVGECFKYHPHGDAAIYDSLVRMAQNFSLRYTLVFGHGNFGSIDFTDPAHMRYTEAKLSKLSEELLEDIEKDTVDFVPNFDGSLKEPVVLPSKIPNLLLNGTTGIAVGMATNIPPHNMNEICDAVIHLIDHPNSEVEELINQVKGPDFPTRGIICGTSGIKQAYKTGRGKIIVKAKAEVSKDKIIITEIPYQVNKSVLIENIADLVRDKVVEGITNIRDESDRNGLRIVIELKRDANGEVILNQLHKHTQLESSFGVIMLALVNNQPKILNLKNIIEYFILHRKEVITRRCRYDFNNAEKRAHILEGLKIALSNIDSIIKLIKSSKNPEEAKNNLTNNFKLSIEQAQAILDMRLQRLTFLEQDKLKNEHDELIVLIKELKDILSNEKRIYELIKRDLNYLKKEYGDERRTEIIEGYEEIETEDLIKKEKVVVTLSHKGYVKRLPLDTYKSQKKGGKGVTGTGIREEDFIDKIFVCNTHSNVLFFSDKGRMYCIKAHQIPEGSRYSKGSAIVNLLNIKDEKINAMVSADEFSENKYLVMVTKNGVIKKTRLSEYKSLRQGLIAIKLRENDGLFGVLISDGTKEIIICSSKGRALRFREEDVKSVGRGGSGVRGISLRGAKVIGVEICDSESLLTITEKGYGKKTKLDEYRVVSRGGSGITNIKFSERNGDVAGVKAGNKDDEVMFITKNGIVLRVDVNGISEIGRNTLGFRLMKLDEGDKVIGVAKVEVEKDFTLNGY